jgi:hypothetical protein
MEAREHPRMHKHKDIISDIPKNFVGGGGSTNSVEDREKGDLEAVAP